MVKVQVYGPISWISSLKTYQRLYILLPGLHGEHTVLQPLRRIELKSSNGSRFNWAVTAFWLCSEQLLPFGFALSHQLLPFGFALEYAFTAFWLCSTMLLSDYQPILGVTALLPCVGILIISVYIRWYRPMWWHQVITGYQWKLTCTKEYNWIKEQ